MQSTILSRVYLIIPLVKAFPTLEHPLSDLALQALAFLQEISRDVPPSIIVCNAAISACEKGETAWEPTPGVSSTAPRDDLTNQDVSAPPRKKM